jgi:Uma2 family endonuclease
LNLELNAKAELIIASPVGGESGNYEPDLITDLNNCKRKTRLRKVFSFSIIFRLANAAKRCLLLSETKANEKSLLFSRAKTPRVYA